MVKQYDVIIVGGGPAGIFAALELSKAPGLKILLIEKGKDIDKRRNLVSGLGGAGAYSDGKLTLSSEVGGRLEDYLGKRQAGALIKYVDDVYLKFGAPDKLYGVGDEVDVVRRQASLAELRLIPVPLRHLGTECCRSVLKCVWDYLFSRIEFKLEVTVAKIIVDNGKVNGIETETGERFDCRYLILAPGREGAEWHNSGNTNFALLVSTTFTKPFREPIAYGKYLARLANILSGGVLLQRFGDLMEGRRSTPAGFGTAYLIQCYPR